MDDVNILIGKNIRSIRKRKGLTIAMLADRLACYGMTEPSQSLLSAWQRGQRAISSANLWYISNALDCTMDDFLIDNGAAQPQRIKLELRHMSTNEQAIVHYGTSQWPGDVHALLRANGMYMQLPPALRCDVVAVLATIWDIAQRNNVLIDVPYDVSVQDIRDKWEQLITKR